MEQGALMSNGCFAFSALLPDVGVLPGQTVYTWRLRAAPYVYEQLSLSNAQ